MQAISRRTLPRALVVSAVLMAMSTGRAMTLAFIHRAGGARVGDPPDAWLMPLLGDAFVGLLAPVVVWLVVARPSPKSWLVAVVWGVVAIFDALAAMVVHLSVPWNSFFMIEIFGVAMFPAAVGMHLAALALLFRQDVRQFEGVDSGTVQAAVA